MGSKKRKAQTRTLELAVAERHGFESGGLLGHDSTYSVNVSEHVALSVDTILACVRILADLTADAGVGEYRGKTVLEPSRLVLRPMGSRTRRTWIWQSVATMAVYSGLYLWESLGRDSDGIPVTVEPVAPPRVNRDHPEGWTLDGRVVDPDTLHWVPRMTMPTLTRELGALLRLARGAFAAAWSADAYRSDFWETGGAPSYYLSSDQKIDNTTAEQYQDRWVARRTAGPGRPPVMGSGLTLNTLSADLAAAGASEAVSNIGASIARYFGVPAWLVNVKSEAGSLVYANSSSAGLDLVRYTLQPGYAGPLADAWSDLLPGGYLTGRRVVLDLRHLTLGTALEQAQTHAIETGNRPWRLPSEIRDELHYPSDTTLDLDPNGAPAPAMEAIA